MATLCKKIVASGARTTVLMREERCFNYLNAKVSDPTVGLGTWKRLEITSESVINEIATLQSAALNPFRGVKRRTQATGAVGGDVNAELANNGYAWIIVQAIGKIVGAGTAGNPYTIVPVDEDGVASDATAGFQQNSDLYTDQEIHYDTTASDVASDSAGFESGYYTVDAYGMEPGFDLMISRDGGTIKNASGVAPTNHLWFQYTGAKVNVWSITATPTEIVTHTFSLLASEEDYDVDMAVPSYSERPAVNDPFTGFNGAMTIDGTSQCVLSFDMNLNNNLGTDQYCMGEQFRNSLPEGQKVIEGTIAIEFTDLVFYKKFVDGTAVNMVIDFDLLGDNAETMKIILPKVEFNGTTPTAGGPEAINQELPYIALWEESLSNLDALMVLSAAVVVPNGTDIAIEIVTAGTLV